MNRSQVLVTLLEEIAGNAAIVYHRTGAAPFLDPTGKFLSGKDIPENIVKEGFSEGRDGMYGPGIYATYKLHSQFRDYMSRYGEYLVKCRVNLQGYIILDYTEAKKVYKSAYTLRQQLSQYYAPQWLEKASSWLDACEDQLAHSPMQLTSPIASALYEKWSIHRTAPGIVFTGYHDDAVVVTYKPEYIIPVEYAYRPVGTGALGPWTAFRATTYTGHLRKVGTLIRHLPGKKVGGSTELDQKELLSKFSNIKKLSKIKSISLEHRFPFPVPPTLLPVVIQKFHDPGPEFYALVEPVVEKEFAAMTRNLNTVLRHVFPDIHTDCQRVAVNTLKFTFTFSTVHALLDLVHQVLARNPYSQVVSEFLQSGTQSSREQLTKSIFGVIFTFPEVEEAFRPYFHFPFDTYLDTFTELVQHAPATK